VGIETSVHGAAFLEQYFLPAPHLPPTIISLSYQHRGDNLYLPLCRGQHRTLHKKVIGSEGAPCLPIIHLFITGMTYWRLQFVAPSYTPFTTARPPRGDDLLRGHHLHLCALVCGVGIVILQIGHSTFFTRFSRFYMSLFPPRVQKHGNVQVN